MDVRKFHVEHLQRMRLQPAQQHLAPRLNDETLEFLAGLEAYTVMVEDEPIACAGLMEIWPGRAMAWSYLSATAGAHMLGVTRAVRAFLDLKAPRRTELYVDAGFEAGRRWAELLGFRCETPEPMAYFEADGRAQYLYSRIRP
jgi:hypothetical protein